MTEPAVSPVASPNPKLAPARANAPAPSRPGALRTPRIKVVLALDARQVLAIPIDETTYSRVWIASPERLLSAEVPTQSLRTAHRVIRKISDDTGFDSVAVTLSGILATTNTLVELVISVMPKPAPINGHGAAIGARRR